MKIRTVSTRKAGVPMPKQNKIKRAVSKPKGAYKKYA
jgi:hypothetical protein